jgi:hypothetical protein
LKTSDRFSTRNLFVWPTIHYLFKHSKCTESNTTMPCGCIKNVVSDFLPPRTKLWLWIMLKWLRHGTIWNLIS